jgi:DNA-binding response OmpR family regulator
VLVVDDSRMVRESVGRTLEGQGYGVEKAADGEEALALLQRRRVSLVLSDVEMPKLDGFALVRRLRELPEPLGSLPVLILSSRDSEADRLEGLRAGADGYLGKTGFDGRVLLEAVHDLIGPACV